MVFSDSTNKQGIVDDTYFLLDIVDSGTTDYPIAQVARNVNNWYDRVVNWILKADGNWEWDDENFTSTRPIATTALVADQQDYSMAGEGILKLIRVECQDSSGNWLRLNPFNQDQRRTVALTEYRKTSGSPREYDLLYNSIFLYPAPSYAASGGLKIYYQRDFDHFTVADTLQAPGFDPLFHRILSYGAALDYAVSKTMPVRKAEMQGFIDDLRHDLESHYARKDRDKKIKITLQKEDLGATDDYTMGQESVGWQS